LKRHPASGPAAEDTMIDPVEIMLVAGCQKGRVDPEIYDLIAFGQRLQSMGAQGIGTQGIGTQSIGTEAMGVWILGDDVGPAARDVARRTGVQVIAVQGIGLSGYLNETFRAVISREMETVRPAFVCASHTSRGWEWAPALAASTGAACVCGVDGLVESRGRICFQRDVYGGKAKGLYASSAATTIITVQPGIFKFDPPAKSPPPAQSIHKEVVGSAGRTRFLGRKQGEADTSHISSAPIIVAVGNGIGDQKNMELIHRLAKLLPHAEVAGTRILCDRGWLGYDRQVGVTGASVSPKLYLACGISGATQHVMGMRGAKFAIAINTDPLAPMFNEADICIVEDMIHFIPLLEDACARLAGNAVQDFVDSKTLRR
jgi:electron transfer flavoprotein alpha subunit